MRSPEDRDTVVSAYPVGSQRFHFERLARQVSDAELADAIELLEWFTDPERRYLVEQLIRLSAQAVNEPVPEGRSHP